MIFIYAILLGIMIMVVAIDLYQYYRICKAWGKIRTIVLIILLFISLFWNFCGVLVLSSEEKTEEVEIEVVEEVMTIEEQLCFADSIAEYIKFLNLKHPETVMRQFQIESANFTSKIFRENNNICGMRMPFKRPNLVIGEKSGYAVYDSWQSSVVDYGFWQVWSGKGLNREEYIQMLGRSYAEDVNYIEKVSK